MDKPTNMSVKEYLMRVLSVRENIPLKTIEAVIEHQFNEAHKALDKNLSIEISGFCKFIYNEKKARKKLEKAYMKEDYYTKAISDPDISEVKKKSYSHKLENTRKTINQINYKLNGHQAIDRRVEKQDDSTGSDEGAD